MYMSVDQRSSATGEIKALTSLRGVAAMAVVMQHFSATAQDYSAGWIPSLVPHGYMAVDFFFVLSGFIISYTYLASFEAERARAFLPFLLKRFARILPLGLFVLAAILILGAIASSFGRADLFIDQTVMSRGAALAILVNVLHLQGFWGEYNLNAPSWSVSIELSAYILFPALIYVLIKGPRILAVAYLLAGTSILAAEALNEPRLGLAARGAEFDFLRCCAEFGYGMVVYRLFRTAPWVSVVGRDRATWAISAFCVAMLLLRLDLLAALSFPAVILAWAINRGSASRLMSSPVPYFLGTVSFSLYLIHHSFRAPELALIRYLFASPLPPAGALAFALGGSLSVIPAAALAYRYVERPGRRAVNSLASRLFPPRGGATKSLAPGDVQGEAGAVAVASSKM